VSETLAGADLILDGSASVAVGRHLSDLSISAARRVSFFFNPDGTDGVLLAEPRDRSVTLRDLEAQYYSMLAEIPDLAGHLRTSEDRIAYSGACRQATNRMPESRVAALSALIAMEIKEAVPHPDGRVVVWRTAGANVRCVRSKAEPWERVKFGTWQVLLPRNVSADLASRRKRHLPAETGGVLLGVVDCEAKSIHLCVAFEAPADSVGDPGGFERGTEGLREKIAWHAAETVGQLSYVGEWHSHPANYPVWPSMTDVFQLTELARLLDMNGVPAVMAIVGDDGIRLHTADIVDVGQPLTIIKTAKRAR
jgi:integrative and conjugative element protein (TIGR02256 family)